MTGTERPLPLPALVVALQAWQSRRSPVERREVVGALAILRRHLGLAGLHLLVEAPPLAQLDLGSGTLRRRPDGRNPIELRAPSDEAPLGSLWADGARDGADDAARAVSLALDAVRAQRRAATAEANLAALDAAVRGIGGVLSLERVLQLIVDQVRELAHAEYAALGILGDDRRIAQFLAAGISAARRRRVGAIPSGVGLLGAVVSEQRAIRIPEIRDDPRYHGFPEHHPEMHSFLGVPVAVRGQTIGNLYLANKRSAREFSEDDQLLVERFARHAGLAIENARLGERVQQLAIVDERERIARDLHDGVIQRIYGVTLALDEVPEIVRDEPDRAAARVDEGIHELQEAIGEIRDFISGLSTTSEAASDLASGIEALADDVRFHAAIEVRTEIRSAARIGAEMTAELLAVAREALSNVVRHAHATRVRIRTWRRAGDLHLEVRDDGVGMPKRPAGFAQHGLRNMERRTERLGGRFELRSGAGLGTRIIISVPLPDGQRATEESERA